MRELLTSIVPVERLFSLLPEPAATQSENVDPLYRFLFWSGFVLFLTVVIPMTWFVIKYRRKKEGQKALSQKDHNKFLELLWTLSPLVYLAILFLWGFKGFMSLYMPPGNAKELRVVGQKWQWTVIYPNEDFSVAGQGAVIGVKLGEPVKLVMTSQDVLHSFFVPNFRVKQDVVPGRYTTLWFEPTQKGDFPVFCAEYCGDQHSNMMATIRVMDDEEYAAWVEKSKNANVGMSPKELGAKLFTQKGCNACHSTDGSVKIGPSFKGLYGSDQKLQSGKTVKIDDNYISHKLFDPQANVAVGYAPVMPSFKGQLKEDKEHPERDEVTALIEFIKSLK